MKNTNHFIFLEGEETRRFIPVFRKAGHYPGPINLDIKISVTVTVLSSIEKITAIANFLEYIHNVLQTGSVSFLRFGGAGWGSYSIWFIRES
jgi:hypothetical protein